MAHLMLGAGSTPFVTDGPAAAALRSTVVHSPVRYGRDGLAWQLEGIADQSEAGTTYTARQPLPAVTDLSPYGEIRLWVSASRAAGGAPDSPPYLAFLAGRGAAVLASWPLTVAHAGQWELHRLDLADLPDRQVDWVAVAWHSTGVGFRAVLDDLVAVKDEFLTDEDGALLALLDGQVEATAGSGVLVPAVLWQPDLTGWVEPAVAPYIRVVPCGMILARDRMAADEARGTTPAGQVWVRPPQVAVDLYYQIEVVRGTRSQKNRLQQFLLTTLCPRRMLWVGGRPLALEWIDPAAEKWPGLLTESPVPGRIPLYFRLRTWQEAGPRQVVVPVAHVTVASGHPEDRALPAALEESHL
ncbi:MAG: hypothetical protein K0R39_2568 [Symbiobacteriaceae bacterium]|nr:hypothetical protein [Symbiobacteriaceae bacterium]